MISEYNLSRLLKCIPYNQTYHSPIKDLVIHHSDHPFKYEGIIQEPSICIVLKGEREIQLGEKCYLFNNQHFMFCPTNIPMRGEIKHATETSPFMVLSMKINLSIVKEILLKQPLLITESTKIKAGFSPWQLDQDLEQAFERLLLLHENPKDIPFLAPLIQQEIYYRLLTGEQGNKIKQMVTIGSQIQQIAKATEYLQQHFTQSINVKYLATLCGMSISGFHSHFKKITGLPPLQYQKTLRLTMAQKMIKEEKKQIAEIAYQIGYESPSQFSREYRRYFGCSPSDHTDRTA
ncbi:AraC family transcriptional regulator [Gallibacterium anatis]|uniref:AraC family transcriptional regulator n=1 Tax=Gallibacterium anatis TaxID=750 RepID=UPI00254D7445|nr:AraC family transcriptional regulator [Gallibacterium anatis]MDK9560130.1 AraC family transcriptional regulator [Gallibacterium anatis]